MKTRAQTPIYSLTVENPTSPYPNSLLELHRPSISDSNNVILTIMVTVIIAVVIISHNYNNDNTNNKSLLLSIF